MRLLKDAKEFAGGFFGELFREKTHEEKVDAIYDALRGVQWGALIAVILFVLIMFSR